MFFVLFFDSVGDSVSDPSSLEILKEPFFSAKLLRLIGILTSFRLVSSTIFFRHVFI